MKTHLMKLMLRTLLVLSLISLLNSTGLARFKDDEGGPRNNTHAPQLTVMTRNLYLGTDFGPILGATSFPEFANAVAAAYIQVEQSNIPERAAAIAREIDSAQPDLIGLQEASIWRTGPFGGPANTVTFDALQSLLDALAARGLNYAPVVIITEFEAEAPSALGINIRFTDRDVVLARTDLNESELQLSNVQAQHFTTNLMFINPILGPLTIPRGWISVDGEIRGKRFRFVTAHLESFHPGIQAVQASELILGPCNTELPVIIAGDLNTDSPSGDPAQNAGYQIISSSGFSDLWTLLGENEPGNTWPLHLGDSSTSTTPTQRIDLILFRGDVRPEDIKLIGKRLTPNTPGGIWPSDHAGVLASFKLKR
ncbi:MAG: endonuclease/exonuclease/phosphatase family protein [Pyrinomonadaceae bacterium]